MVGRPWVLVFLALGIAASASCAGPQAAADAAAQPPPARPPHRVTAAPNETVVLARVDGQETVSASSLGIQPEMPIHRLQVTVERVESGSALRGEGPLVLLTKQELPALTGTRIRAAIEYRGDERGGGYWLKKFQTQ